MKSLLLNIFLLLAAMNTYSQKDTSSQSVVETPMNNWVQYLYNPIAKQKTLSYNYSNLWDFDNDGIKDSLVFMGNRGAHAYFYPQLKLTSLKEMLSYPSVLLDMPYFTIMQDSGIIIKHPAIQLVIGDFDKNSTIEMYLNFDNNMGQIPASWKKAGIRKKTVILSCNKKQIVLRDY